MGLGVMFRYCLAVHVKLYPVIYGVPILLYMQEGEIVRLRLVFLLFALVALLRVFLRTAVVIERSDSFPAILVCLR